MRFTTIVAVLAVTAGIIAHPGFQASDDLAELTSHGDKPSKLWPKPLQDDWRCMKREGEHSPDVKGDWSRKKEGIFTAWGFSSTCCKPFSESWKEYEGRHKTRGIRAEFFNTKGGDEADCDKVVMSHIKKLHWPYLNRFWRDFGVVPEKE